MSSYVTCIITAKSVELLQITSVSVWLQIYSMRVALLWVLFACLLVFPGLRLRLILELIVLVRWCFVQDATQYRPFSLRALDYLFPVLAVRRRISCSLLIEVLAHSWKYASGVFCNTEVFPQICLLQLLTREALSAVSVTGSCTGCRCSRNHSIQLCSCYWLSWWNWVAKGRTFWQGRLSQRSPGPLETLSAFSSMINPTHTLDICQKVSG